MYIDEIAINSKIEIKDNGLNAIEKVHNRFVLTNM